MGHIADLATNPSYQLWQANNGWLRAIRRALEPCGLTYLQFFVLAAVERLSGSTEAITQAHLARIAELDENMTSQIVRCLERKGLLIRQHHLADRRAHILVLTEAGQNKLGEAREFVALARDVFFAPLGEGLDAFVGALRSINEAHEPGSF